MENPASYAGSGTTLTDLSPAASNATLVNGLTWNGTTPKSIETTANNDYISCGSPDFTSSGFSMCAWVKPDPILSPDMQFFGQGTSSANAGLHIHARDTATKLRIGMYANDYDFSHTMSAGTWYLLIFTYDGSTYEKKAYQDNVALSDFGFYTVENQYIGTGVLRVGTKYSSGDYSGRGEWGVIAIYDRVISAMEREQLYDSYVSTYK